jgi:predicted transposase YdaD
MLQLGDIRETRVYQEAKEEGKEEGKEEERQRQLEKNLRAIGRLAALRIPPAKIAEILEIDVAVVRKALAKRK